MAVVTTNPRVTAADPGAFLDGEDWTFTVTFTDPVTGNPTDLTGSQLFAEFSASGPAGTIPVRLCASAANDGSLVISPGTGGQATFTLTAATRTWSAPRFGPGFVMLPALVLGDVYRQIGGSGWVGLTRLTLRVLPTTGRPPSIAPGQPGLLNYTDPTKAAFLPALNA